MTKQDIINALNALEREIEAVGESFIECVIDAREDEGLPPFTAAELAAAEAECDRNAEALRDLYDRRDDLREEYFDLCGNYPIYNDDLFPAWRERYPWE